MKIYKYTVDKEDKLTIPMGSRILKCEFKDQKLYFWAAIEPDMEETQDVYVGVFATGVNIPTNLINRFYNTVFDGPFVWHIFLMNKEEYDSIGGVDEIE